MLARLRVFSRYEAAPGEHDEMVEGILLEHRLRARLQARDDSTNTNTRTHTHTHTHIRTHIGLRGCSLFADLVCIHLAVGTNASPPPFSSPQELKEYRRNGIRTLADAEVFDTERRRSKSADQAAALAAKAKSRLGTPLGGEGPVVADDGASAAAAAAKAASTGAHAEGEAP